MNNQVKCQRSASRQSNEIEYRADKELQADKVWN